MRQDGRAHPASKDPAKLPWPTGHAAGPTGRGQGAGRETAPQANRAPPSAAGRLGRRTRGRLKEGRKGSQMESDRVVGVTRWGEVGSPQQTDLGGTSMLYPYLRIRNFVEGLFRKEEGQTLTEYALILVLIAIAAIVAMLFLGSQISAIFSRIGSELTPTAGT